MLDVTSIYTDPRMRTLGTNSMIKMLPKQGYLENPMLHTYYFITHPQYTISNHLDAVPLNVVQYHWNSPLKCEIRGEMSGVQMLGVCLLVPVWILGLVGEVVRFVDGLTFLLFPTTL